MSDTVVIRIDEWMDKVETTSEGTFLHISKDIKISVLEEMVKVLRGCDD